MGLFKFAKSIGSKIFGASEAQAAPADAIKKAVAEHGLDASGIDVKVDGDKVSVSGKAATTEQAEKIILAIGNSVGVAQVDSNIIAQAAAKESVFYTVAKGDTLWAIAEKHYGKGKGAKYSEIVKANTPPVKNPDLIQPGWVLRIPPEA
ncbi:peptidoglycan-binding protein LysM [Terrarubrum flagellatum]|uniref:peptidoglycan-binding protein LysM n=1 Tax=Terrirubrum flagellatum TaxID=2895980 RepID=UPI003145626F